VHHALAEGLVELLVVQHLVAVVLDLPAVVRVRSGLDARGTGRLVTAFGNLFHGRSLFHGLWILMIPRRVTNLLIQIV